MSHASVVHALMRETGWFILTLPQLPRICALQFDGRRRSPSLKVQIDSSAPSIWTYVFRNTRLIFGIGAIALVPYLEEQGPALAGCSLWIYMGSNIALAAMTRGDSNTAAIAALVARLVSHPALSAARVFFPRALKA